MKMTNKRIRDKHHLPQSCRHKGRHVPRGIIDRHDRRVAAITTRELVATNVEESP